MIRVPFQRACLITLAGLLGAAAPGRAVQAPPDQVAVLLQQVEAALTKGSTQDFLALSTLDARAEAIVTFLDRWFTTQTTRATVRERDRIALEGGGQRLTLEVLVEAGAQGRVATWRMDVVPAADRAQITAVATLSTVDGLHRLLLDTGRQFRARNLVVRGEDLELHLPDGMVFVAQVPSGTTAVVLLGRGEMVFSPAPETERRQIELLTGTQELRQSFNGAFLRFSPFDSDERLPAANLTPVAVNPRDLKRAQEIFGEEVGKSFSVDLADLSRETWSLLPSTGDLLAEVRTRRMGTLTYTRASNDPEDISVFEEVSLASGAGAMPSAWRRARIK